MDGSALAGRYRLLGQIGRGGMGRVWQGHDELLDRPVAVKTLDLDSADPPAAERFRREAQLTAGLTHPNIVTVFDSGVDGSIAFLVMELLPGPTLEATLASGGALPVAEVLRVGKQMTAALAAAHAAGVVHRDVKPSNVAYAADHQVKVLDFGVARLIEATTGQTRLTQTQMVVGTANYLSPEQASGTSIDARTDLYSLGCLLFALLSGHPPFTGDNPIAVCAQHVHAQPPDLASIRPDAPRQLTGLVGDLLRKAPADRPPNATAVGDRLAAVPIVPEEADQLAATPIIPEPTETSTLPSPTLAWGPDATQRLQETPSGLAARVRAWPKAGIVAGAALIVAVALVIFLSHALTGGARHFGTTTSTTPPPPSPAEAITKFSDAVLRAESAGALAPPAAQDLLNRMRDLMTTINSPHTADAGHKVSDLLHRLDDLLKNGQLTSAGQRLLAAPLAALEQAIPPQP